MAAIHASTLGLEANPARNATWQVPRPFRFETASTFWCHRHRQSRTKPDGFQNTRTYHELVNGLFWIV